jgi:hypothetical protein
MPVFNDGIGTNDVNFGNVRGIAVTTTLQQIEDPSGLS